MESQPTLYPVFSPKEIQSIWSEVKKECEEEKKQVEAALNEYTKNQNYYPLKKRK